MDVFSDSIGNNQELYHRLSSGIVSIWSPLRAHSTLCVRLSSLIPKISQSTTIVLPLGIPSLYLAKLAGGSVAGP